MKKTALLSALLFAGCATVGTPAPDPYQAMADQATKALKAWRVTVTTHTGDSLGTYYCRAATIELGLAGNSRWLLAHEIGHHILGHCDESFPNELQANAVAIKVLQVWGDTEEVAVLATEKHILSLCVYRKKNPRPGHSYYAEFQDVAKRFPQYPTPDTTACLAP